ncbi:uncharacterized protein LOC110975495 [Acanthaster planci]|uniref:Uncharacterized protein LOC110975495 n=1 Tax=Acanthaster planci TaxID=133434 RepID=A0A8B7XS90_ACAPL|nr:uncharacterized protein LOC110975495 [Acanthaster planci]
MGVTYTISVILVGVLVGLEILEASLMLSGPASRTKSRSFDVLSTGSLKHGVIALSERGSKQRCAAACAAVAGCAQFCYASTTRRCVLEDASVASASRNPKDTTCYLKNSDCMSTFTSGSYFKQVFDLPPFGGKFVLDFSAKVMQDAIVSLSTNNTKEGIKYELVLGHNGNSKTTIRRTWQGANLHIVLATKGGVVSALEMRRFWLRYDHGTFALGKHREPAYFEWTDPLPQTTPVRFIGLGGWADTVEWIVYGICP